MIFFRDWYGAENTFENIIQCLNTDYPQQHALMAVINLWTMFFQQRLKNLERITKIYHHKLFVLGNIVNDPLNV